MSVETQFRADLLAFAPMAVFLLAALFATLAVIKRQSWLTYFRRLRWI
ncbi:MAG: hypothetical protein KF889_28230 [Alphaproteobacteria bacterium]|nr:hypothetical protein [Alphaproteobacteria bacterium]MCW5743844.1 hypothetical protein [Alphaproteobacteria bacterium]